MEAFLDIVNQISSSGMVALDEFWNVSGSNQDRVNLIDTIEDVDAPDPSRAYRIQALKETLAAAIQRLPERERIVIGLYYYEGFTLKEIGEVLGVTESRVSQLHTKAILAPARPHQGAYRSRYPGLLSSLFRRLPKPDPTWSASRRAACFLMVNCFGYTIEPEVHRLGGAGRPVPKRPSRSCKK